MIRFVCKKTFPALAIAVTAMLSLNTVFGQDSKATAARYPLIPYPTELKASEGVFRIDGRTKVVSRDPAFRQEAEGLVEMIKKQKGVRVALTTEGPAGYSPRNSAGSADPSAVGIAKTILIDRDESILSPEGYKLSVTPKGIVLTASASAGVFYGVETIRQLMSSTAAEKSAPGTLLLPSVSITDAPVYSWRGLMLDVSRHFFSVDYLKKFIDRLALYKMNQLHLHLTDDQGWRIEIKKYPELTEKGAWRTYNNQDSDCFKLAKDNPDFELDKEHIVQRDGKTMYGGFYTQEQMKDLIRYATARHVDIVPELDMPGHMMAAIRLFPWLACQDSVFRKDDLSSPICPCHETTFGFAQNIFAEIADLFPSPYIHLGSDEVPKSTWAASPECQAMMKREGIKSVEELQSYFAKRMEKFFKSRGKRLIGWDEILEGGIDTSVLVMYWRGWVPNAPIEAARQGNQVVMSPTDPMYFDAWPNKNTLHSVYTFEPVPAKLTGAARNQIIGVQANMWSERIPSEKRADYMNFPRITALAEVGWSHRSDFEGYLERLNTHYRLWDALHIHYRMPDLEGFTENNVLIDSATLMVDPPMKGLTVRYTLDGSFPGIHSPAFNAPVTIRKSLDVKLAAFSPGGNRGEIAVIHYKKVGYAPAVSAEGKTLEKGLTCVYHKGVFDRIVKMDTAAVAHTYTVDAIAVPSDVDAPSFGLRFTGYIDVPETGVYSFYLLSDDGSTLHIDDKLFIDNDGFHSAIERSAQIALRKGLHVFNLGFVEGGGGYSLKLKYSTPGGKEREVPAAWFKH
ncbi:MAG: family 20 glycosylhydrolase [Puia sp.]|nr:family 20 glycosylhydrolase [Puia sp.]